MESRDLADLLAARRPAAFDQEGPECALPVVRRAGSRHLRDRHPPSSGRIALAELPSAESRW